LPCTLSSFRREFARAPPQADIHELVDALVRVAALFKPWWRRNEMHAPCSGLRELRIDGRREAFEYLADRR